MSVLFTSADQVIIFFQLPACSGDFSPNNKAISGCKRMVMFKANTFFFKLYPGIKVSSFSLAFFLILNQLGWNPQALPNSVNQMLKIVMVEFISSR